MLLGTKPYTGENPVHFPLNLVILEDQIWSQTVGAMDSHWLQNLTLIHLSIEIASNDSKPYFSTEVGATLIHHIPCTESCWNVAPF